ncbi:Toxin YoeB [Bordetella ansorpii]|uniref:Putative mRNA interferase YoeB n=1 Tax=Bordetella ansorpii TaxID=288768 RepID=A0A157RNG0_9BORD|nr:Txe/YoeB family addiction module toxin [Bordetella ansorpii]SAI59445.1 Toxin YoeB [Bordetella ansorpii]
MSTKKGKNKNEAKGSAFCWTQHAWEDYLYWQQHDPAKVTVINRLLEECRRDPFKGTGKPEPLKGELSGFWSRRIDQENRLVYLPEGGTIYVVQARRHY